MKKIVPAISVILGVYWVWKGIEIGLMVSRQRIGGGLIPLICGLMALVFGVLELLKKTENEEKKSLDIKWLILIGALIVTLIAIKIIGMLPSFALLMFFWMLFYEKLSWKKSLLISLITVIVLYLIFGMWLKIRFPRSLFTKLTGILI